MTSEIAAREFGQRLVAFQNLGEGGSFLEKCVRKLLSYSWTTANNCVEFGTQQNVC